MEEDYSIDNKLNHSVLKEAQTSYSEICTVKKEKILEDNCTYSNANTIIKEEFIADGSDSKALKNKYDDNDVLCESLSPKSDTNAVIKEEVSIVESESTFGEVVDFTVIGGEEIFLEEADHEQFIDESCSYDVDKDIITEEEYHYENQSFDVRACVTEDLLSKITQNSGVPQLLHQNVSTKNNKRRHRDVFKKTTDKRSDTGGKKYKCDICKRGFKFLYNLSTHMLVYSRNKKYECDICSKIFHSSKSFSHHKLLHSEGKKFQCDVCNKCFSSRRGLMDHKYKVVHSHVKKYTCDVCNKAFITLSKFTRHKLVHRDAENNKCDVCNKVFTYQGALKKHKLTHTDNEKSTQDEKSLVEVLKNSDKALT